MTAAETKTLASLRRDLASYHIEICEHITRCEACRSDVSKIVAEIYGAPGNRDKSPGLVCEVAKIRGKWHSAVVGLRCIWAVLTLAVSAVVAVVVRGM